LKKKISNSILRHYSSLFTKYGINPKSIGWSNGRQLIRFNVINNIGKLDNSTILDVGCGFGDFYGFLKHKKIKTVYHGVDINEDFVKIAKKRYSNAKFEMRDIQKKRFTKKFDWVVAVGITNHASTYAHLRGVIEEMFHICRKGVAIDFISNYVDYKNKEIFYSSPEKMFVFAKTLTKRVTLRHDYMPFEFSLYLFKDDRKNNKNVFRVHYQDLPISIRTDKWLKK